MSVVSRYVNAISFTLPATGTLLARPGSNHPSLKNVEIRFSTYAIDFGKSLHDAARGYWVRGIQNGLLSSSRFVTSIILCKSMITRNYS